MADRCIFYNADNSYISPDNSLSVAVKGGLKCKACDCIVNKGDKFLHFERYPEDIEEVCLCEACGNKYLKASLPPFF